MAPILKFEVTEKSKQVEKRNKKEPTKMPQPSNVVTLTFASFWSRNIFDT